MSLEDKFHQAVEEWREHCSRPEVQVSSLIDPGLDCDAYRRLVAMDKDVLPYIRRAYADESEQSSIHPLAWYALVQTIVGEGLRLPEDIATPSHGMTAFSVDKVKDFCIKWLDENMHKYRDAK